MRFVFVLPFFPRRPVGGCKVVYEYANHLTSRGHAVAVLHLTRRRPNMDTSPPSVFADIKDLLKGLLYSMLKPRPRWVVVDPSVKLMFVPNLHPENVPEAEVVFATAWQTALPVLDLPSGKGAKFYLIQHYETWAGPKEIVDSTWRSPLQKVVIAEWLYSLGLELGCDPAEMAYITLGLNHEVFRILRPISDRPPRVAMMYSTLEWKGCDQGLKALIVARARIPELQAVLFGVYDRPKDLPAWIEYFKTPVQEDLVGRIYNSSSVFVCPSWVEGWPAPPAEAMACGCAVVTTDCKGIREYAEDGVNALLSAARDTEALTRNLMRLLGDDKLRQQLAMTGNERIKQFTWERSTDLLEEFVQQRIGMPCQFARRSI